MFTNAKFICSDGNITCAPIFKKTFSASTESSAKFVLGGLGTYDVFLNGRKIGNDVLSPGWQNFNKRICTTTYELDGLEKENTIVVLLTTGWYAGRINIAPENMPPRAIIGEIMLENGNVIVTDESWQVSNSQIVSSDIYDGIVYDANIVEDWHAVEIADYDTSKFVEDTTVQTREFETVFPAELIVTPKGERVLDFGADIVGYPVIDINAKKGEKVCFSFAEILVDGNFYNENYRSAKCVYDYTCKEGHQTFTPRGTFYGFRYVRIDEFPAGCDPMDGSINACVIHADMKRTGNISSGNPLLNRLYANVIRGHLGNYLAIPTDCPQRDERRGWTGDTQVFVKAAAYNFDVYRFIYNWLIDLVSSQNERGAVITEIPFPPRFGDTAAALPRAAWSDAVTICPWEMYMVYGKKEVLELTFDAMCKHVDCMGNVSKEVDLFCGCPQYGDWLGLDAPAGSYKGSSSEDLIASAYYAYSTEILCKVGDVLGKDVAKYKELYQRIRSAYIKKFVPVAKTQTECILTLKFGLTDNVSEMVERLVARIHAADDKLETGFVGTPYILHALSENGHADLAYTLLLNTEFPSWLYPVTMGATTMWEHWDGIRPDGKLWSADMNSYNHYAYGAVADWIYSVAGGIKPDAAGYAHAVIAPQADKRLGTLDVTFDAVTGHFASSWYYEGDKAHYTVTTPVPATIIIEGKTFEVQPGTYVF